MKVLITGAAGNVGSACARALHAAGFDLRLTDRRARKDLPAHVDVLDLRDREGVYRVVEGCETIVHLGNHPNIQSGDAQTVYAENCAMNANVFEAALELGVKKVVFMSSVQVMNGDRVYNPKGSTPPTTIRYLPADSDTPPNPRNTYALSKLAGEDFLKYRLAKHGIDCVAIRLPWAPPVAWWDQIRRNLNNRPPHHLDELFAVLHVEDAGSLVAACVQASLPGFRVYFPAMRSAFTSMPLPEAIKTYFAGVELRKPIESLRSLVDTSRITAETGWEPKYDVHDPM